MKSGNIQTVLIGFIALVLFGAVLKLAGSILLPLVLASILSVILGPLINRLDKWHFPRSLAVIIVILVLFGVVFLVTLFLQTSFYSFIAQYPKYAERFIKLNKMIIALSESKLGVSLDIFKDFNWTNQVVSHLMSFSGSVMNILKAALLIMIFLIFLLLENPFSKRKLLRAFDRKTGLQIARMLHEINRQVARYLNLKFFISLATGICVWFSLKLIGMDFALMWGVLAFLLNFIPTIGSGIILFLTILMGIIQFYPSLGKISAVIISMSLIQLIIGNFLDPRMQGHRLNLSPLIILFSLVFWGWIWGIVGMFLAVPITVIIQIICKNIPYLKPVSIIMSSGKNIPKI